MDSQSQDIPLCQEDHQNDKPEAIEREVATVFRQIGKRRRALSSVLPITVVSCSVALGYLLGIEHSSKEGIGTTPEKTHASNTLPPQTALLPYIRELERIENEFQEHKDDINTVQSLRKNILELLTRVVMEREIRKFKEKVLHGPAAKDMPQLLLLDIKATDLWKRIHTVIHPKNPPIQKLKQVPRRFVQPRSQMAKADESFQDVDLNHAA
jgi:hypothetical protein